MRYPFNLVPGIPAPPSVDIGIVMQPVQKLVAVASVGQSTVSDRAIAWGAPPDEAVTGFSDNASGGSIISGGVVGASFSSSDIYVASQWQPSAYADFFEFEQIPPSVVVDENGFIGCQLNQVQSDLATFWNLSRGIFKLRLVIDGLLAKNVLTISVGPGGNYGLVAWTIDLT
jgi:hypothetical protein